MPVRIERKAALPVEVEHRASGPKLNAPGPYFDEVLVRHHDHSAIIRIKGSRRQGLGNRGMPKRLFVDPRPNPFRVSNFIIGNHHFLYQPRQSELLSWDWSHCLPVVELKSHITSLTWRNAAPYLESPIPDWARDETHISSFANLVAKNDEAADDLMVRLQLFSV